MKKLLAVVLMMMIVLSACNSGNTDEKAGGETSEKTNTEASTDKASDETPATDESDTSETAEPANDLSGKTVTVGRWGGNDAETAAFNQMLEDFTAATGVKVEERVYSDFNQELQAELIGGTAPDVFYLDAYMAPFYVQQGVVLPLDAGTFEIDEFYGSLASAFEFGGDYYAVSKDYSTLALYYNKKWVDEADIPTSMEELLTGDFLTNLQGTLPEDVIAMTYNQDLARQMYIAESGGLDIVRDEVYANLSAPAIVENLSLVYDAAAAGKIKTPADLGLGWNGDAFGNEKTAIMIEGNWSLGFLNDNFPDVDFGVIEVPTIKGQKGTMVFTVGYAINAASKNVDAATAFIKYATGVDGMTTWTTGAGVLPSRDDVTVATDVASDPKKIAHIAGADYATPWQKGTTMDTINNEFRNYIPSVVTGERTLVEALELAESEANSIIEANQ